LKSPLLPLPEEAAVPELLPQAVKTRSSMVVIQHTIVLNWVNMILIITVMISLDHQCNTNAKKETVLRFLLQFGMKM
jgi:hypothetical protein